MTRDDLLEKVAFIQSATSLSIKKGGNLAKAVKAKPKPIETPGKAKFAKPPRPETPKALPKLKAPTASKVPSLGSKSISKFKGSTLK